MGGSSGVSYKVARVGMAVGPLVMSVDTVELAVTVAVEVEVEAAVDRSSALTWRRYVI